MVAWSSGGCTQVENLGPSDLRRKATKEASNKTETKQASKCIEICAKRLESPQRRYVDEFHRESKTGIVRKSNQGDSRPFNSIQPR